MFSSQTGDFDIQQKHIDNIGCYVVSSGVQNNGVVGKSSVSARIIPSNTITIDMFGNVFFRDFEYKMVTHARVFSLEADFLEHKGVGLYVSTLLTYLSHKFSYSNMASWNKVKNLFVKLPVDIENKIDYNFMDSYMRELEQERIRELEQYLRVTGLDTYALTPREHEILTSHASGATRLFRIGDLFDIHPTKSYGVTNITLFETQGHVPVVVNSSINNGVGGFVNLLPTEKGGIITYSDTTTADAIFYQPIDFIGYSHVQGLYPVHKNIWNERRSLYFLSAFKKIAQGRFDYATKFNRQIAKELQVCLPVTQSGDIDYDYMETYIRAIEKVVIRGVVEWKNKVIEATKSVVNA